MKEREPLNFASTTRAPPVGRRCAILGGGIFNRNYGEFSTGVDSYIENRFHLLDTNCNLYLLATAVLFFFLAYRFDNRFVLSLALSSLAGWFGLTISHWPSHPDAAYRQYALIYFLLVGLGGTLLQRHGLKPHFFGTYLNVVANVLFWALLSGVFNHHGYRSEE